MAWKPSSVLREAMLAGRRAEEDEAVVRRYELGAGRGHDMAPMRAFVRKVRGDLGPRAVICDVEINGEPRNVSAWVVWYYFPGQGDEAPRATAAPNVNDLPMTSGTPTPGAAGSPMGTGHGGMPPGATGVPPSGAPMGRPAVATSNGYAEEESVLDRWTPGQQAVSRPMRAGEPMRGLEPMRGFEPARPFGAMRPSRSAAADEPYDDED